MAAVPALSPLGCGSVRRGSTRRPPQAAARRRHWIPFVLRLRISEMEEKSRATVRKGSQCLQVALNPLQPCSHKCSVVQMVFGSGKRKRDEMEATENSIVVAKLILTGKKRSGEQVIGDAINARQNSTHHQLYWDVLAFVWCCGKKADIRRFQTLVNDPVKIKALMNKTKASLSNAAVDTAKLNARADAFGVMERDMVDMKVMRCLCANGIPLNLLRSPQWAEMISAIDRGPKGYKNHLEVRRQEPAGCMQEKCGA